MAGSEILYDSLAEHPRGIGILKQYQEIHEALDPDETFKNQSAALEISKFSIEEQTPQTVQEILLELKNIQSLRDEECRKLFIARLKPRSPTRFSKNNNKGPNPATVVANTLDAL